LLDLLPGHTLAQGYRVPGSRSHVWRSARPRRMPGRRRVGAVGSTPAEPATW